MSKRTIRLQPSSGKFLQTSLDGRIINIFLVDPKTNIQGTEVNYDDAIRILAFKNPVAIPVPVKGKDGKYIKQLTSEDIAKIEEIKNNGYKETTAIVSSDNSALENVVASQNEVIKSQMDFMTQMKKEMDELKSEVKKMNSKSESKAKAKKEK